MVAVSEDLQSVDAGDFGGEIVGAKRQDGQEIHAGGAGLMANWLCSQSTQHLLHLPSTSATDTTKKAPTDIASAGALCEGLPEPRQAGASDDREISSRQAEPRSERCKLHRGLRAIAIDVVKQCAGRGVVKDEIIGVGSHPGSCQEVEC